MSAKTTIKLGKIYKRKSVMISDLTYPEYIILTSIRDKLGDQYRYNYFDIMRGKESLFIMRGRTIEESYDLVEDNRE